MRTAAALSLAIILLCAPALAGEGAWKFKPGSTYTWEGKTEFHYLQSEASTTTSDSGPPTGGPVTVGDPQWETVTLKATVLAVEPDGTGRLEFLVEAVRIETRFDTSGEHAEWDSSESQETDVEGYKRYQAILGNRFRATVGPDGTIRSIEGAEWAPAGPTSEASTRKTTNRIARIEKAARETHAPTPPSVWLSLIFRTTPERRAEWTRPLSLPREEEMRCRADGDEQVGAVPCVRAKLESVGKRRVVKEEDIEVRDGSGGNTVGDFAMALCHAARKRGTVWFSRTQGCLVRAELESATEYSDGQLRTDTHFKWDIELKARGTAEDVAPDPGTTPTK